MADDLSKSDAISDPHQELQSLRAEFERSATPLQRFMVRIRCHIGSPSAAIIAVTAVAGWVLGNAALGRNAIDPSPYPVLNTIVSVGALIATILILAGQRREDEAAKRISRLTLHLAAESEQKIAKLIQLVEEQRRDSPTIPDRHDPEAEQMSSPAGPRAVLERLEAEEITL